MMAAAHEWWTHKPQNQQRIKEEELKTKEILEERWREEKEDRCFLFAFPRIHLAKFKGEDPATIDHEARE